jgi:hypothetical protein
MIVVSVPGAPDENWSLRTPTPLAGQQTYKGILEYSTIAFFAEVAHKGIGQWS